MNRLTKKAFIDACRKYAEERYKKEHVISAFMKDMNNTVRRREEIVYIPGSPGLMEIWKRLTSKKFAFETLWNLPEE